MASVLITRWNHVRGLVIPNVGTCGSETSRRWCTGLQGTLEAAGHLEPIEFTANVQDFTDRAVSMTADLVVDRLWFGMTWSPMRIAAYDARGTLTARFVRP